MCAQRSRRSQPSPLPLWGRALKPMQYGTPPPVRRAGPQPCSFSPIRRNERGRERFLRSRRRPRSEPCLLAELLCTIPPIFWGFSCSFRALTPVRRSGRGAPHPAAGFRRYGCLLHEGTPRHLLSPAAWGWFSRVALRRADPPGADVHGFRAKNIRVCVLNLSKKDSLKKSALSFTLPPTAI